MIRLPTLTANRDGRMGRRRDRTKSDIRVTPDGSGGTYRVEVAVGQTDGGKSVFILFLTRIS
jgi:hypothetical protein